MGPYGAIKKSMTAFSILCCLMVPALWACGDGSLKKRPVAAKGILDLRGWDFERDGAVDLDGEWQFCWNRLLGPSDFTNAGKKSDCAYITVPGLWKNHLFNGHRLPGKGQATYRLKIICGRDSRPKALILRRVLSGYRLWLNGKLADNRGTGDRPIKTREDYVFIHNRSVSSFTLNEGENEIVLQVSNHDHESGGIGRPVKLDDGEAAGRREFHTYTVNMIVIGLLLFGAFYNILFYSFRGTNAAPLYIGFTCLVWAVNTFNIQSPVIPDDLAYPGNPFFINYSTVIAGTTLCMMIIQSLFPDDFSTRVLRSIQVLFTALIVSLFFAGFKNAEIIVKVFFMITIFLTLYCLYVFIVTIRKKRDDAVLFFASFLTLFAASFNNMLYAMWIIDTGNAIHYAMVILCFTTTLVVARRFSRALWQVEELSKDLAEKNISLRKLDRIKDQFLANTSHELRTPLHGMIGLSESMVESAADRLTAREKENLALISSSGHRLANMVNDLLDMARIQDEGLSLDLKPVDLFSLSEMAVRLSLPLVGDKLLEIVNAIRPDIPAVHADEDRIRQVLSNLIGNAVKFTHKGRIWIDARVIDRADGTGGSGDRNMVEVTVSDTGIGVPDECREKIFAAYQQVDGSDTRSYGGTGLGLAIAKEIIELHGGTLGVASREQGGSVFTFTLPVSGEPAHADPDDAIIKNAGDALTIGDIPGRSILPAGIGEDAFEGNPVILIVDDDPVNVRVVQNYFELKKCVVKTAADGIAALDIIDHDRAIDLVLLDIMMPVMSGYDVCRRIRASRTPEELPVIMVTAKNMMADIDAAFEAGANDYIVKPFRISELLARVSTMLKLRNVRRSAAEGITLHDRNTAYSLTFKEIVCITASSRNIVIHTEEREITAPLSIKEIIRRLPPDMFAQIHKSHIINLRYLRTLTHVSSGRYRACLHDPRKTELPVGRAFLEALRKKM